MQGFGPTKGSAVEPAGGTQLVRNTRQAFMARASDRMLEHDRIRGCFTLSPTRTVVVTNDKKLRMTRFLMDHHRYSCCVVGFGTQWRGTTTQTMMRQEVVTLVCAKGKVQRTVRHGFSPITSAFRGTSGSNTVQVMIIIIIHRITDDQ